MALFCSILFNFNYLLKFGVICVDPTLILPKTLLHFVRDLSSVWLIFVLCFLLQITMIGKTLGPAEQSTVAFETGIMELAELAKKGIAHIAV